MRHGVRRLESAGRITGLSSIYETSPVGHVEQRSFLNLVVRIATSLSPERLLERSREIEKERGRRRRFRDAPRTLDIDLLLYGDAIIRTAELEVPHPRMGERAFVLVPLLEVQPDVRDPATGERYADRLRMLTGESGGSAGESPAPGVRRVLGPQDLLEGGDD